MTAAVGAAGCSDDDGAVATLTVEELLARSADTAVQVTGVLFEDAGTVHLCSALLESAPPQCGDPAAVLSGLDLEDIELERMGDVRWAETITLTVQRQPDATFLVLAVVGD